LEVNEKEKKKRSAKEANDQSTAGVHEQSPLEALVGGNPNSGILLIFVY